MNPDVEKALADVGGVVVEGGKRVVNGTVILTDCNLSSLEELGVDEVRGSLVCTSCHGLRDLKGSPSMVTMSFYCDFCDNLVSLAGCPKVVGHCFKAGNNRSLKVVDHCPQSVFLGVDFSYCPDLSMVLVLPVIMRGMLDLRGCPSMTTLGSMPTRGLTNIKVDGALAQDKIYRNWALERQLVLL